MNWMQECPACGVQYDRNENDRYCPNCEADLCIVCGGVLPGGELAINRPNTCPNCEEDANVHIAKEHGMIERGENPDEGPAIPEDSPDHPWDMTE